jgi:hypothetical protein
MSAAGRALGGHRFGRAADAMIAFQHSTKAAAVDGSND